MPSLPTPVVFILVIAICAIVGLCNGLVVSYLKVQPFIATLGMQQVVYGICLVYTGGTPIGSLNKNFTSLASNTILKVPVLIWIALIVAVCFWFLYNKTRHGKYMYAIGGNEAAAEVAGVNVYATKIRIYILASCMFGLAGCLLAAKSGGASVNTAMGYELDAIAASTIGGVSTTGGVGTVPGILVGVLVFELMKVALQFMNVNSSYTYIVQGLVIIVLSPLISVSTWQRSNSPFAYREAPHRENRRGASAVISPAATAAGGTGGVSAPPALRVFSPTLRKKLENFFFFVELHKNLPPCLSVTLNL